jgi:hypothetical protein
MLVTANGAAAPLGISIGEKTVVRRGCDGEVLASADTPGLLADNRDKRLVLAWAEGRLSLSLVCPSRLDVTY